MHFYPEIKQPEDMSNKELLELFTPLNKTDYWLHNHLCLLWRAIHWNWFNVFTGEEGFLLFLKHWFREWHK